MNAQRQKVIDQIGKEKYWLRASKSEKVNRNITLPVDVFETLENGAFDEHRNLKNYLEEVLIREAARLHAKNTEDKSTN